MSEEQNAKAVNVNFNADIIIDVGKPRPELSHQYAKAYEARNIDGSNYIAMVCENGAQPRTRMISQYANVSSEMIPNIVNANVIAWPTDKSQRMAFIYDDRLGSPLADKDINISLGWKPEKVLDVIVKPTIQLLKSMRDVDLAHGGIRPTRFYDGGKKDRELESALLGECLSAPTSATQPAIYESLERGMAHPMGRGPSTITDDLYSLGVTAAVMLRTKDVLRNPSDADMIRAKQEVGSFIALLGDMRISGALLEFLRGVLADTRRDRWNIEDALAWLDGRRTSPKQPIRRKPASRPYDFMGTKYLLPQVLASEFLKYPNEAAVVVESEELKNWVSRALVDGEINERLETVIGMTRDPMNKASGPEKVAAYSAVALDTQAPIRYKDLAFLPEGLGALLSDVYAKGGNVQNFVDILQSNLQSYWVSVHSESQADIVAATQKVEQCRSIMRNANTPGFGLERIVYMLNADSPCLSPMFRNAYVRTPEDVVLALNEACKQSPKPARLIDRHIIAFLAERDRKSIEMHIFDINSGKASQVYLGTLRCLAALQRRARMDALPELTHWMADLAKPVYPNIHDRDLREEMRKRVEKVKDEGRLWRLLDVLTDPELLARDLALFNYAMNEYRALQHERDNLEIRLMEPQYFGKRKGMEVAVMISSMVAFIVAAGLAFVFLQGGV